ncbi:MAG: RnfH family protein [Steroidobacteraceae bacterium]
MTASDSIQVQLVCAWPERAFVHKARVPAGTTALQLLEQSRAIQRFPELAGTAVSLGVFGRKVEPDYVLAAGDRVELLRELVNDPKDARRRRATEERERRGRR